MIDSGRNSSLIAALLLACVVGGFWMLRVHLAPPPEAPFSVNDIGRYFYPFAVSMHRDLYSGSFPLWNPYQMAGMPLFATQHLGQLYPPNLVLWTLFPAELALEARAVAHLFIAGFFMWLFARRLQLGFGASLCAGVAYMLSGTLLEMFYSIAYVSTCAWLPAVMWASHGLARGARLRDAVALSVVLALAFLSGYAQGFVFELQFGAVYGLTLLLFGSPPPRPARVVTLGILSAVVVVGLVAAQLVPSIELLRDVPRAAEGLSLAEAGDFSEDPVAILRGLIGEGTRFATTILALPLIACGLLDRRRRKAWFFFTTAAVMAGLFALGERTPVFPIYHALPGGDLFRFPYRIAFVYAFCVSALVGIGVAGVQHWLGGRRPDLPRLPGAAAALAVLVILVDFHAPGHLQHALVIPPEKTRGASDALLAELYSRRLEGRAFNENFGDQHSAIMPHGFGMMNQISVVPTYEPMIPRAYADYFGQDRLWRGFVNVVPPKGFSFSASAEPKSFPPGGLARLLDLMSVRFYSAHSRLSEGRLGELERFAGGKAKRFGQAYMVERRRALPRAYLVHEQIIEPDPKLAWKRLLSPSFAPERQAVVARTLPGLQPAGPDEGKSESASVRAYESESVVIEVQCSTRCLLVLTDLDYPGWVARVDGAVQPIVRVNTLFRGLLLDPGLHQVEYLFRPLSFRIGAALTISTLVLLFIAAGFRIAHRERSILKL